MDPDKEAINVEKHGVQFADAAGVLEDDTALWRDDEAHSDEEERLVAIRLDYQSRVLVVVFTYRGDNIRLISARIATRTERAAYERRRHGHA